MMIFESYLGIICQNIFKLFHHDSEILSFPVGPTVKLKGLCQDLFILEDDRINVFSFSGSLRYSKIKKKFKYNSSILFLIDSHLKCYDLYSGKLMKRIPFPPPFSLEDLNDNLEMLISEGNILHYYNSDTHLSINQKHLYPRLTLAGIVYFTPEDISLSCLKSEKSKSLYSNNRIMFHLSDDKSLILLINIDTQYIVGVYDIYSSRFITNRLSNYSIFSIQCNRQIIAWVRDQQQIEVRNFNGDLLFEYPKKLEFILDYSRRIIWINDKSLINFSF